MFELKTIYDTQRRGAHEKLFLPDRMIMDFEFFDQSYVNTHLHQNPELLTVLEGSISVSVNGETVYLETGG